MVISGPSGGAIHDNLVEDIWYQEGASSDKLNESREHDFPSRSRQKEKI